MPGGLRKRLRRGRLVEAIARRKLLGSDDWGEYAQNYRRQNTVHLRYHPFNDAPLFGTLTLSMVNTMSFMATRTTHSRSQDRVAVLEDIRCYVLQPFVGSALRAFKN